MSTESVSPARSSQREVERRLEKAAAAHEREVATRALLNERPDDGGRSRPVDPILSPVDPRPSDRLRPWSS
jgi:hypothetical protein